MTRAGRAAVTGATTLVLGACAPKAPPPPAPAAPPSVGVVEVTGALQRPSQRELLRGVLATAVVAPCYELALSHDPRAYGEVVVRFEALADGRVDAADIHMSTLGDPAAESCVLDAVRALSFPGATADKVTVLYPFLFTSDATPPEVARALKVRYGLLPEEPEGDPTDPREKSPPGVIYMW